MNKLHSTLILVISICLAGGASGLATFYRVGVVSAEACALATAVVLAGCVPPIWFTGLISDGSARQLAVVVWRLGVLLPSLLLLQIWDGDERNCFLAALLVCYFVALPLESWLLIRDVRRCEDNLPGQSPAEPSNVVPNSDYDGVE